VQIATQFLSKISEKLFAS